MGAGDEGWKREGKTVWTIDMRRSVGEGWGGVHRVNTMDTTGTVRSLHDRDFQEGKQGI